MNPPSKPVRRVRTALVTGAAKGIGRGIALALARTGHDLAIHFHHSETEAQSLRLEAQKLGVRASVLRADLTKPEHAQNLVLEAKQQLGGLGVLVNNVGNYVNTPFATLSLDQWGEMMDTNLNASFYTCHAALPLMRHQGFGRIINLGYAGSQNLIARPNVLAYAIAKTGVLLLTKAIAQAEAAHGITANLIAPGVIENSLSKPLQEIPLGRLGRIDEIASAVEYLTSAQADYITGQTLELSGGWNL